MKLELPKALRFNTQLVPILDGDPDQGPDEVTKLMRGTVVVKDVIVPLMAGGNGVRPDMAFHCIQALLELDLDEMNALATKPDLTDEEKGRMEQLKNDEPDMWNFIHQLGYRVFLALLTGYRYQLRQAHGIKDGPLEAARKEQLRKAREKKLESGQASVPVPPEKETEAKP